MICRSKEDKFMKFTDFFLSNVVLEVIRKFKYLGHTFTDDVNSV